MMIPLINPSPSFRKFASRVLKRKKNPCGTRSRVKNPESKRSVYKSGFMHYYSGQIKSASKKRPAVRRGFISSKQEGSMVYSLKRRPRRKSSRRARRNPKAKFLRSTLGTFLPRTRKHRKIRVGGRVRYGAHRPKLIYTHKGWHRSKRSKLFRHATLINPRRSSHRRTRRNPALPFAIDQVAIGGLKLAGGIVIGTLGMPVIVKFMPETFTTKYRKFYGLIHVVLGAVVAGMIKKPLIKDIALTVAGVGVYDLIASNLTMLGLPALPNNNPLLGASPAAAAEVALKGMEPGVIGMDADFAPALGSSYQAMGASYGSDDIAYGDDDFDL